jgi:hypothetical protein
MDGRLSLPADHLRLHTPPNSAAMFALNKLFTDALN